MNLIETKSSWASRDEDRTPRFMQWDGDSMSPTIRSWRDYVLVIPTNRFEHDALYHLRVDQFEAIYRVQGLVGGGLRLMYDNPKYEPYIVDRDWFNRHVVHRICAILKVEDERPIEAMLKARA